MLALTHSVAARRIVCRVAGIMAVAGIGVLPVLEAAEEPKASAIESLGWMAGCWAGSLAGGSSYEEMWLAPRGGVMLGVSRTVREEKAVGHEFLRIAEEDGALVYLADPSGQEPTRFTAVAVGDGAVTFANPEHDFPQRILYRLESPDSLIARIEGKRQRQTQGVDFPLRRVPCRNEAAQRPTPEDRLFVVRFTTGPAWDTAKPFGEQKHAAEHSANLRRMRAEGFIVFGGRFADTGLIVVRAPDEAAVRAQLARDPSLEAGTFRVAIDEYRPFFSHSAPPADAAESANR